MKGDILLDSKVVLSGIDVNVHIHEKPSGLKNWYSSFTVNGSFHLSQGEEYQLNLFDRKSGRILITRKTFSAGLGTTLYLVHKHRTASVACCPTRA